MPQYADTSLYSDIENRLWEKLTEQQGKTFLTAKGLPFTYTIRGNEILFSRKEKAISRATVNLAYRKMREGNITGSKQLGVFGASYLYPVLRELRTAVCAP